MKLAEIKAKLEENKNKKWIYPDEWYWVVTHLEASLAREEKLIEGLKFMHGKPIWAWTVMRDMCGEILSSHSKALEDLDKKESP